MVILPEQSTAYFVVKPSQGGAKSAGKVEVEKPTPHAPQLLSVTLIVFVPPPLHGIFTVNEQGAGTHAETEGAEVFAGII